MRWLQKAGMMNPSRDVKTIFLKAVEAVDPHTLIARCLRKEGTTLSIEGAGTRLTEDLSRYETVLVLGVGKASASMAGAVEHILKDTVSRGAVITTYGQAGRLERIRVLEAGHPIPDENSVEGARILAQLAREADSHTLILNLVSGGGSALFSLPREGITLRDKQETTRLLLESGAAIAEINCIRKHLSSVKGGNFAKMACPARMINLILSDVVGDRLEAIASGITAPDPSTFREAFDTLKKYRLVDKVPSAVKRTIESGIRGTLPETPKEGDPAFENVENILVGNNLVACRAAEAHGRKLGYDARILTSSLTGEAREIAKFFASIAKDLEKGISEFKKPALLISGGETTVTIRGKGKGGRNQEMALAFLADLLDGSVDLGSISFLSAGTDGADGPTDAAGAFVSSGIEEKMEGLGLKADDFLDTNDSYRFFEATDHLFKTGPTGTNVCDIQLLIVV